MAIDRNKLTTAQRIEFDYCQKRRVTYWQDMLDEPLPRDGASLLVWLDEIRRQQMSERETAAYLGHAEPENKLEPTAPTGYCVAHRHCLSSNSREEEKRGEQQLGPEQERYELLPAISTPAITSERTAIPGHGGFLLTEGMHLYSPPLGDQHRHELVRRGGREQ